MKQLYVIGDSISIDYGPALAQTIAGTLSYARKPGLATAQENLDQAQGTNAGDSRMLRGEVVQRCADAAFQPNIVVFNCGLHDIKMHAQGLQVSLLEYAANLQAVCMQLEQARPQAQLLWVRTTPINDELHNQRYPVAFQRFNADVEAYNEVADQVMLAAGIPIIDLYTYTAHLAVVAETEIYRDHAHFKSGICVQQGQWLGEEILAEIA